MELGNQEKRNCTYCFYNFLDCVNFIYGLPLFLIVNIALFAYLDSGLLILLIFTFYNLIRVTWEKNAIWENFNISFHTFHSIGIFNIFKTIAYTFKIKYTHTHTHIYKPTYVTSLTKALTPASFLRQETQTTRIWMRSLMILK